MLRQSFADTIFPGPQRPTRGMRLRRLALLQPRRAGSIGIVAISVQATGAPALAAASSGGKLGSQCTARKRRPVTPSAASDTSFRAGVPGWVRGTVWKARDALAMIDELDSSTPR